MSTDYSLSYILYIFSAIEDKLIEIITDQMNFVLPYFFITRRWAHKMKHNFEFNAKNRNNSELLDWPNWPPYVDHGLKATVVQVYCLTIWSIAIGPLSCTQLSQTPERWNSEHRLVRIRRILKVEKPDLGQIHLDRDNSSL